MTAHTDTRRIPGESGTWVFLFGDILVFGAFFLTFLVERAKTPATFDAARTTLHIGVGVLNTMVLLTSSLFVVLALGAMRAGARAIATRAAAAAIACGLAFIALKVFEYVSLAAAGHGPGPTPSTSITSSSPGCTCSTSAWVWPRWRSCSPRPDAKKSPAPAPHWSKAQPASGIWSTCCGSSSSRCCTW